MSESRASSAPPICPPVPGEGGRLVYTAKQQMSDAAGTLRLKIDTLTARHQYRAGGGRDGETIPVVRYLMDADELR